MGDGSLRFRLWRRCQEGHGNVDSGSSFRRNRNNSMTASMLPVHTNFDLTKPHLCGLSSVNAAFVVNPARFTLPHFTVACETSMDLFSPPTFSVRGDGYTPASQLCSC